MDGIPPHLLWIGHAGDGDDLQQIHEAGIKAIVQVALEEPPLHPPRELIYARFPLIDGGGNRVELLGLAITTVVDLIRMRVPTLFCCGAGMSRSPAIAAAALAVVDRQSPEDALSRVACHRRHDVSPGLWSEVADAARLRRQEEA